MATVALPEPAIRPARKFVSRAVRKPGAGPTTRRRSHPFVLAVNYDTEKDLKRRFNVRAQSTLVVLHGQKESYRVVGDTSPDGLRSALKSAL